MYFILPRIFYYFSSNRTRESSFHLYIVLNYTLVQHFTNATLLSLLSYVIIRQSIILVKLVLYINSGIWCPQPPLSSNFYMGLIVFLDIWGYQAKDCICLPIFSWLPVCTRIFDRSFLNPATTILSSKLLSVHLSSWFRVHISLSVNLFLLQRYEKFQGGFMRAIANTTLGNELFTALQLS